MDDRNNTQTQTTRSTDWAAIEFKPKKAQSRWTFGCTGVGVLIFALFWGVGQLPKLAGTRTEPNTAAALRTVIEDARGAAEDGVSLAELPSSLIENASPDERVVALVRHVATATSQHRVAYHAALDEAEIDRVLDPKFLLADGGVEKARARLDVAMRAFAESASGIRAIVKDAAEKASGPGYPPGFQRQFESSEFGPRLDRHLESERRVLRAIRGVVDAVGMGDIGHDGVQWTASSQASSEALQRAFSELDRATTFQQSLLAESERSINDTLDALAPK